LNLADLGAFPHKIKDVQSVEIDMFTSTCRKKIVIKATQQEDITMFTEMMNAEKKCKKDNIFLFSKASKTTTTTTTKYSFLYFIYFYFYFTNIYTYNHSTVRRKNNILIVFFDDDTSYADMKQIACRMQLKILDRHDIQILCHDRIEIGGFSKAIYFWLSSKFTIQVTTKWTKENLELLIQSFVDRQKKWIGEFLFIVPVESSSPSTTSLSMTPNSSSFSSTFSFASPPVYSSSLESSPSLAGLETVFFEIHCTSLALSQYFCTEIIELQKLRSKVSIVICDEPTSSSDCWPDSKSVVIENLPDKKTEVEFENKIRKDILLVPLEEKNLTFFEMEDVIFFHKQGRVELLFSRAFQARSFADFVNVQCKHAVAKSINKFKFTKTNSNHNVNINNNNNEKEKQIEKEKEKPIEKVKEKPIEKVKEKPIEKEKEKEKEEEKESVELEIMKEKIATQMKSITKDELTTKFVIDPTNDLVIFLRKLNLSDKIIYHFIDEHITLSLLPDVSEESCKEWGYIYIIINLFFYIY
jgi:hypothetical protein